MILQSKDLLIWSYSVYMMPIISRYDKSDWQEGNLQKYFLAF